MRVCVGDYHAGCKDVLEELDCSFQKDTQTFPIKEMTKAEMLILVEKALDLGVGVQIQHPHPNTTPPYDYLFYVDTPKGRFRQR